LRVWFVSNGRGEDRSAALIARGLSGLRADIDVLAAPIVGDGDEYRARGVPVAARGARPASGGFSTVNPLAFFRDLPVAPSYLSWFRSARHLARPGDRSLAVGDMFALLLARAAFGPAVALVSLPKSSLHLPHSSLERRILQRVPRHVFTRDPLTAQDLSRAGVAASWSGNPLMDDLASAEFSPTGSPCVALLPGSRREALGNLQALLDVVDRLDSSCALRARSFRRSTVAGPRRPCSVVGGRCRATDFEKATARSPFTGIDSRTPSTRRSWPPAWPGRPTNRPPVLDES
jgi:uncharacterized protein (TIGR03492 family)